jgi:prevent-host-death family protein
MRTNAVNMRQMSYSSATIYIMNIASRELRNDTASVLRKVQAGEEIIITVRGRPVAQLTAVKSSRKRPLARNEFVKILQSCQSDPGLKGDLEWLAGDTTDEYPIQ